MKYSFMLLLLYVGVVTSFSLVTLDPLVIDQKPVNNAQFSKKTSDLYGTNFVGKYKWISKSKSFNRDVVISNINEINDKNLTNTLFCPRTDQNPFMALYLKTSTNGRFVCKEKLASYPIKLFCEPNPSRLHKCSNLYNDDNDDNALMSNQTESTASTGMQTDNLKTKTSTTNSPVNDLKVVPSEPFVLNSHFLFIFLIVSLIICVVFFCCLFLLVFVVIFKRTNIFSREKHPLPVATVLPTIPERPTYNQVYYCGRCQNVFAYPHYCPEQSVGDPLLQND